LQDALLVAELQKAYEHVEKQVLIELQQEIAERQRAEEEIRHLQQFLQNIIDSMPSILVGVDIRGYVTHWNREAERVTGITAAEAQGRYLPEVYPRLREQMTVVWRTIQECLPQRVPRLTTHDKGRTYYADLTIYPLIANGAEGAVIRLEDTTEQERIGERMIQSEKMMTVAGLAAGMAHEINNPLGIILQGIQNAERRLCLELPKNQEVAAALDVSLEQVRAYMEQRHILQYLDTMQEAGTRAAQIVSNMLKFSNPAPSAMVLTDLNQLLDLVVELASSDYDLTKAYNFQNINIIRAYESSLPKVPCISSEIQQVVLNMLRNATQALKDSASPDPPTIQLATHKEGQAVRIEITDNGSGMDEDTRKRVFEPFYTTKVAEGSTGLGLSISYFIIVTHHRGEIFVDSALGSGTTFTIMLPLSEA
jgi:PAS domain S-box-containing protein